jgi:hypothetical protein
MFFLRSDPVPILTVRVDHSTISTCYDLMILRTCEGLSASAFAIRIQLMSWTLRISTFRGLLATRNVVDANVPTFNELHD